MAQDSNSKVRLTSGELSRLTGVPQQTLIRWDRSGVLKARRPRKGARAYDEGAVVAALFAFSISGMGFSGSRQAELIRLVQSADPKKLKRWVVYSYFTDCPGLIGHDCGDPINVGHHIESLRARGWLIGDPTDLWTMREHLLNTARGLIAKRREILGPRREED